MWEKLFTPDIVPYQLVLRGVVVYLSILLLLRVSGKRQLGQMGATEFVAILLISNAVQNSMNGGDNSLGGGLILALTLIVVSSLISYWTYRSDFFSSIFEGTPTLLIRHGKVLRKNMNREQISEEELRALLRKQGNHSIQEIETGILEADGTLSISKGNDEPITYIEG